MKIKDIVKLIQSAIEIYEKNYDYWGVDFLFNQIQTKDFQKLELDSIFNLIYVYNRYKFSRPLIEGETKKIRIIPKMKTSESNNFLIYEEISKIPWFNDIRELELYKKITEIIKTKYQKNVYEIFSEIEEEKNEFLDLTKLNPLDGLIMNIFLKKSDNSLNDELVIEYSEIFKEEINQLPTEYILFFSLAGLYIANDPINISDNIIIKLREDEDIAVLEEFAALRTETEIPLSSPLLKVKTKVKNQFELNELEYHIFTALRLFKLGTIYHRNRISFEKTALKTQSINIENLAFRDFFIKYRIKKGEEEIFIGFVSTLLKIFENHKEEDKNRPIFLSIERFNWALFENVSIDRRILFTIMGLEPLFTMQNERSGQAYKLSVRIAKLLSFYGFNPNETRDIIQEAYNFRNRVTHGSNYKPNWEKRMVILLPKILNYLRISIITFLFNIKLGKDKLVKLIDDSIINSDENQNLEKHLEKNSKQYDITIHEID